MNFILFYLNIIIWFYKHYSRRNNYANRMMKQKLWFATTRTTVIRQYVLLKNLVFWLPFMNCVYLAWPHSSSSRNSSWTWVLVFFSCKTKTINSKTLRNNKKWLLWITVHYCIYMYFQGEAFKCTNECYCIGYLIFACMWLAGMWWALTWTNLVRRRSICIRMSSHASHIQVRERRKY